MASVQLHHVWKRYPHSSQAVVKDVHLEIADKEFVVFVGPSGCGKSTTLRMIAGLEDISEGDISIGGEVVNDLPPKSRDIAMVFQNYALYPNLSVFENMAFGLRLRKVGKADIDTAVKRASRTLDIEPFLNRKPRQLSGGQRQRVALGRAIVRSPKVFLMDEPLSNLDAKLRVHMRAEIIRLHRDLETTFVYVTHDQTEAMTMGTRIVVMKDGVVQQVDTPERVYNRPANLFVAGFIGAPPMNFVDGRIADEDGTLYFHTKRLKLPIPDRVARELRESAAGAGTGAGLRHVTLGLRPEHLGLAGVSPSAARFGGTVDVAELMGADRYLYVNTGEQLLTVRTDARIRAYPGEKVEVAADMECALFFRPDTGERIGDR
ncbi:ABC transporter ATP-binding protein [Paenibacillus flagellatus]|uniref:Sugar ABC transporter ATP-binding protein n=1 Tax=Paenibacillus flagellatus TaxID=2211139 RepID=A0A2V5KV70_9BACL|nr:sn-glycerol-3-phosphate ABC transporter ATP-binding protein UgpC [Paenibacillus flagellatus]PYI53366.1 sugar ABC transporter ATP-binding protein [Paenibacillus flagellatus]